MSSARAIAWIAHPQEAERWGAPAELGVPLHDRGLLLADGLFETLWVEAGRAQLLRQHLERWHRGAALLGMEAPPTQAQLEPTIATAIGRSGGVNGALRLNWSRGDAGPGASRGLAIPAGCRHRCWLVLTPAEACFTPVRTIVSPTERRCSTSLLSRCKTFAYGSAIQARRQAEAAGADDALLASSGGGLSCGTAANLLVRRGGRWLTPPLSSGCLPGVMRGQALALGMAEEAPLGVEDLLASRGAVLLNSLGCRPIAQLEGQRLPPVEGAERFWRALLEG
ncbi:aminotransferase class IV [Cyanobium sp. NIES-981]|uniref:aminotransferase class IV n=1 Tax=Cyanobium sp. NIES-981 TaxID=1851505 RepID=UPI0007DCEB16|nr:aminotransferase class IV [Cyanobium sp. NIES-981]SBO44196.1 Aminotransferase class IV [Cyanobium sp. NIES-981]